MGVKKNLLMKSKEAEVKKKKKKLYGKLEIWWNHLNEKNYATSAGKITNGYFKTITHGQNIFICSFVLGAISWKLMSSWGALFIISG